MSANIRLRLPSANLDEGDMMRKMHSILSKILAGTLALLMLLGCGMVSPLSFPNTAAASGFQPIPINETTFPDAKFRAIILSKDYDRDGDTFLSAEEIAKTINIYCEGKGIKSIKGVEYFTALQGLWCKDNQISTMDLTHNKDLHGVWCSGNLFTSLDFSANPELEWVYCYDCKLTSLNVSNNPKMAFIECNTNPLPVLDVSANPLLEHLTCGTCKLTVLNLSNNPKLSHLDAFSNKLTSLDVSKNTKLKRLDIWNNPGLGSINISNNKGLQYYNCAYNGATSINVTNNPELQKLICSYNSIKTLDVSKNPKLVYLDCACNNISSLNLSNNPKLYFLQAFTNSFKTLDISKNSLLVKTYKEGKKKYESAVCKGHSWTLNYGGATSTGGDNLYFICFDDGVNLITEAAAETPEENNDKPADTQGNTQTGGNNSQTNNNTNTQQNTGSNTQTAEYVTREKAAQRLYEMAGKPAVSGTSRFKDVKKGASYEAALLWGEKFTICVGTPDVSSDTFGVGRYITRQDLALMLMRYCEYMGYKRAIDFGRSDDFLDYYDVDYYAWEAICWAATWDIMPWKGETGASKDKLRIDPHGKATKSDFDTMIKRLLEVNKGVTPHPKTDSDVTLKNENQTSQSSNQNQQPAQNNGQTQQSAQNNSQGQQSQGTNQTQPSSQSGQTVQENTHPSAANDKNTQSAETDPVPVGSQNGTPAPDGTPAAGDVADNSSDMNSSDSSTNDGTNSETSPDNTDAPSAGNGNPDASADAASDSPAGGNGETDLDIPSDTDSKTESGSSPADPGNVLTTGDTSEPGVDTAKGTVNTSSESKDEKQTSPFIWIAVILLIAVLAAAGFAVYKLTAARRKN